MVGLAPGICALHPSGLVDGCGVGRRRQLRLLLVLDAVHSESRRPFCRHVHGVDPGAGGGDRQPSGQEAGTVGGVAAVDAAAPFTLYWVGARQLFRI